jgi:AmmeMemoRadiSam system protein B
MLLSNYPLSEFIYIFSSDLSHFLSYNEAKQKDARTIEIISQLDLKQAKKLDACGIYPLLVFMQLAIQKGLKPELIEYKNSGDITGDKSAVVGYSSWVF